MRHKELAGLVGPPEKWQQKRDCQIKFLLERGLKQHHYLLDLGCGVLRGGIPIINYLNKGRYYGIEKDPKRLEKGLKEFRKSNLTDKNPTLSTDYANLNIKFDYIWSFQVFIHFSDEILEEVLFKIKSNLKDKGVCYATVALNKSRVNGSWLEYPYSERPFSFYEKIADAHDLTVNLLNYDSNNWRDMLEIRKRC